MDSYQETLFAVGVPRSLMVLTVYGPLNATYGLTKSALTPRATTITTIITEQRLHFTVLHNPDPATVLPPAGVESERGSSSAHPPVFLLFHLFRGVVCYVM